MSFHFNQISLFFFKKYDVSSLAFTRIIIGLLLLMDMIYERGLSSADIIWSDSNECRFPLFESLSLLPMRAMFVVYAFMFIGNVGIILGLYFKWSCIIYLCCYWYLFLLDKSRWNNHSYLFGLLVLLLSTSNANYKWSIDSVRYNSTPLPKSVPFWQYFLIRSQIVLVYSMAGIKKFDSDWLNGYSMDGLSEHWVFSPFRIFLSNESIDYYIIHLGGFLFDLTIGFFLVYSKTRPIAYLFCLFFNLINSRIFSIGVFPYMMIGVMPIFSSSDWPNRIMTKLTSNTNKKYQKKKISKEKVKDIGTTIKEKITLFLVVIYLMIQLILPNSHWLTKGYNTWTNGLYGYSWDMMVHNWRHIHTTVTVVDANQQKFYLNPQLWTKSWRWSHHSDMVKQFAVCAHKRLTQRFNITDPSIYIDSWISMNGRFAQRVYDPRVDIVRAEWTPFKKPEWVLPILSHLAEWRPKLKILEESIVKENENNSILFLADFPGLTLNNYISSDFENISLIIFEGSVKFEVEGISTQIMKSGDRVIVPKQCFSRVTPIKSKPAAYAFLFAKNKPLPNEKEIALKEKELKNTKTKNPWIKRYAINQKSELIKFSFENIFEGIKLLVEIGLTLFKRLFICLNNCV